MAIESGNKPYKISSSNKISELEKPDIVVANEDKEDSDDDKPKEVVQSNE